MPIYSSGYDSDEVDESNYHQNFRPGDVGVLKVDAPQGALRLRGGQPNLGTLPVGCQDEADFDEADLTIVAIDSPGARELVTNSAKAGKWAICTCSGDSFMFLTETSSDSAISMVTQSDQKSASCQLEGAISEGRIEAGNISVAAVAQTWVLRSLRSMSGEQNARSRSLGRATVLGTLYR